MNQLLTMHDAVVDLLAHGLLGASTWQVVLVTLVFTHITIA
ncbi:MAG: putative fatty acid desaturase, partial [Proteobacteria bacterium]|nr:putative fatty acid desaturase [Pseudomonadota bacterium]